MVEFKVCLNFVLISKSRYCQKRHNRRNLIVHL